MADIASTWAPLGALGIITYAGYKIYEGIAAPPVHDRAQAAKVATNPKPEKPAAEVPAFSQPKGTKPNPTDGAKARKRAAAKQAAEDSAAAAAAAVVAVTKAAAKKAAKEAEAAAKLSAAQFAKDAADAKAEKLKKIAAEEKVRKAKRAATKEAEDAIAAEKAAAKAAFAARASEIAKEQAEAKVKKAAKDEAKRKQAAARKVNEQEKAKKAAESAAAAKRQREEEAAEEAAERKIQFETEEKKRASAANWEESGKAAYAEIEAKKAKEVAKYEAKMAKAQAKADAVHELALELEAAAAAAPALAPEEPVEPEEDLTVDVAKAEEDSAALKATVDALAARTAAVAEKVEEVEAPAPVAVELDEAAAAARARALEATKAAKTKVKRARADVIAPPAKGVPVVPEKYVIFDDDTSIGKKAPTLGTIEALAGEPVMYSKEKGTCILFWSKAFKGDYPIMCQFGDIADDFGDDLQFVGISIDGKKEDAEGAVKKFGSEMKELAVKSFGCSESVAWDNGSEVKDAFQKTGKLLSLMPSSAYIIDKDRNIVWREVFAQGHHMTKGLFREQVRRFVLGEPLCSAGNRPVEEEVMEEMDMGDDYDSDLGF